MSKLRTPPLGGTRQVRLGCSARRHLVDSSAAPSSTRLLRAPSLGRLFFGTKFDSAAPRAVTWSTLLRHQVRLGCSARRHLVDSSSAPSSTRLLRAPSLGRLFFGTKFDSAAPRAVTWSTLLRHQVRLGCSARRHLVDSSSAPSSTRLLRAPSLGRLFFGTKFDSAAPRAVTWSTLLRHQVRLGCSARRHL